MGVFCITARMLHPEYSGCGVFPSPGKILGALLSAAYTMEDDDVVAEVRKLVHCEQPSIHISHGMQSECLVASYSASNPIVEGKINNSEYKNKISVPGVTGGKTEEIRRTKKYDGDVTFSYSVSGDIGRELISRACEGVHYLGKGHDFCVMFTQDSLPADGGMTLSFIQENTNSKSRGMRMWDPSLLDFYDAKYQSVFVDSKNSYVSDGFVKRGVWKQVKKLHEDDSVEWLVIPTKERVKQKCLGDVVSEINHDAQVGNILPMVDNNGYIRGIAVPYDPQSSMVEVVSERFIDLHQEPSLMSQDFDTWSVPSKNWVSATPYVGHHDPAVVIWEIEKLGFTVKSIKPEPYLSIHGRDIDVPQVAAPYQSWYIELYGDHSGVLHIGHNAEYGFGVFTPLSEK